ncbi:MAG: hypothetical protein H8D23_23495, partial [Candidatus Brocadiales bacterium]|nr:hypothetical protein [Candidatus Brocadiales bacterium]
MLSEKKYNELRAFVHKIPYFRMTVLHPFRLVKRLPLVPYYLIAIPFVVLLRVLRFYVVIRFAQPDFSTFGHALFPELYLCERDLGLQERKGIIDVFYTVEPPANKVLFRKFQEHIRLYPQSRLLAAIDAVNRWIHGYQDHIIYIKSLNWRPDFFKRKPVSVTYGLS